MNDLAEKALHFLDVARRAIAIRPVAALSVAGCTAAGTVMVTGARIGAAPAAVPLDHWFGLLPDAGHRTTGVETGVVMLAAIAALIGCWLLTLRVVRVRKLSQRQVWTIGAVWALPFLVGPPVLLTDIYSYVARGLLQRLGLSPYHHGPAALGARRIVSAIDPQWRSTHSTDGPLATLGQHLVVSVAGGNALASVIVMRVIAVVSLIVIGRAAIDATVGATVVIVVNPASESAVDAAVDAANQRASAALCLSVLNPAMLIFVVSAGHLSGVLIALVLAALAFARRRRWALAVVLMCVAAGIKPVALIAVPAVIAAHAIAHRGDRTRLLIVRDTSIAVLTLAVATLVQPFGLGWLSNLGSAASNDVPFAPASIVADVLGWVVRSASYDDLLVGGRAAAGVGGAVALVYLFATIRSRPLERSVGFGLLTAAILAPVVYAPFLLWGAMCLAPTATGIRRDWVIALSCAACVLAPAGLGNRGGDYATIGLLTVIAIVLAQRLLAGRNRLPSPAATLSVGR